MSAALFILAGTGFLAALGLGIFTVLVISIHRTGRRLTDSHGKPAGAIARRVLTGIRTGGTEDGE